MKIFISTLALCLSFCVFNVAIAGMPEADELLSKAAAFERWGERMFNIGDVTAAEAAFYQANKLQAEAEELQLTDVDLRSDPLIQRLALIVEDRLEHLNEAQEEVSGRLQQLEEQVTRRLEGSSEGLQIDLNAVIGDLEEISTHARESLNQLRSEFAEFGEQLLAERDRDEDGDDEEDDDRRRSKGHHKSHDREDSDRPRRIHMHAALGNLSAPPVAHHLLESIKHLHAAGMHEAAEQLDRALDMAREQLKDELGDDHHGPSHGHHRHFGDRGPRGDHDREHGEHGHHRAHAHDGDRHHHAHHGDREHGEHGHGHRKPHEKKGHHRHGDHDHHHASRGDGEREHHAHGRGPDHDRQHRGPHGHHRGDHDRDEAGQIERLQDQIRELTERIERVEKAVKKKHKSRDDD